MRLTKEQIKDMIREEISLMLHEVEVQNANSALDAQLGSYWKTIFGNWRALNFDGDAQSFGDDKEAAMAYAEQGKEDFEKDVADAEKAAEEEPEEEEDDDTPSSFGKKRYTGRGTYI